MKPASLAAVPFFLLGLAGGPLSLLAAPTDCIRPSDLSLGGISLQAGRRDVTARLGRPQRIWKERLDRHLDHLVYPGLEVQIGEKGTVEGLVARSGRYASPSGVRVGRSWEEVRGLLGLEPFPEIQPDVRFGSAACEGSGQDAFMAFTFDRDLRLSLLEVRLFPSAELDLAFADRHEEDARRDPFPWSKGPLEYLAMLRKHRRRAHIVEGLAPPGWVKESDLPALIALLKDARTCAMTQRANEAAVITTHSSIGQEARFLIEGFREDEFPPSGASGPGPKDAEILTWWDEWRKSKPILPWPQSEPGIVVGSTYQTDLKYSVQESGWTPVAGMAPRARNARIEWLNPDDFFPLEGPSQVSDGQLWASWKPILVTFRVVSQETAPGSSGELEVIYRCLALRVDKSSWRN